MSNSQDNYQFYINDIEPKQRVSIKDKAYLIIKEDISNFYGDKESESFSGFLNRIFTNYYENANASIQRRYDEKKDELERIKLEQLCDSFSSDDQSSIKKFIKKYLDIYEMKLIEKVGIFKKEKDENKESFQFRINKENCNIISNSEEAKYYDGSCGLYFRAIFEEYASLPNFKREQIFFKPLFDSVNIAIEREKALKITIEKSKLDIKPRVFYLYPYKIVQDKTNTYNYIIGYSKEFFEGDREKTDQQEKIPACFRLSRIIKANVTDKGAHVSQEKKKELDDLMDKRDVMYMTGEVISIKVKFTDLGLEMFKRQLYMRPKYYEIEKNDKHCYVFSCTQLQAVNYFFKFGSEISILEPLELRNLFKEKYEQALKNYK